MNTKNSTPNPITPAHLAAYRAVSAMDIADTAVALQAFLAHRGYFAADGDANLATAAQRAWWIDALLLAAEPVTSQDDAQQKIAALKPASDSRRWTLPVPELRSIRAMIAAAIALKQERWSATNAAENASPEPAFMQRVRRDSLLMEQSTNEEDLVIAPVLWWQANIYRNLTKPVTLVKSLKEVWFFADHRTTLQASGEAEAAAGATMNLRYAVLKLAGVAATSAWSLTRKARVLRAHRDLWADRPLAVAMIEAAVMADAEALAVEPAYLMPLLRTLRGQA